jgi:uncharacterized protein (TIGR02118 family)
MQEWPYRLIKALAFIHRKIDISAEDFKEYYETIHAPLANSLLSLEGYERNYIIQTKNPKFNTLGSISIFKYQSTEALEIIGQEMSSSKGDNLRKDELNFMDVSRNYHLLTETTELTARSFNKKLFFFASNLNELNLLNDRDELIKISDNILIESDQSLGIVEYGIKDGVSLESLRRLEEEQPKMLFVESISSH